MIVYHRTDVYAAYRIVVSGQIWSKDPDGQANFHTDKFGGGSICKSEVTLAFEWRGPCADFRPEPWPGLPGILFNVPWLGDENSLWSMVIFPGTYENLFLVGISDIELPKDDLHAHKLNLLKFSDDMIGVGRQISVPLVADRISINVPDMQSSLFLSKILRRILALFRNARKTD